MMKWSILLAIIIGIGAGIWGYMKYSTEGIAIGIVGVIVGWIIGLIIEKQIN